VRHTETRIYQRALELVRLCKEATDAMPVGYGYLSDQLRRSAASVVLNYAEGYGKTTQAERRRFFQISRASAYEVAATLDVAQCLGVIPDALRAKGADCCDHIAAMLTRLGAYRPPDTARR
jgi:four helix bundle protein